MPGCPHAEVCGGCALWHIDSATQIAEKQQHVATLLQFNDLTPAITGPTTGYRNKARLGVKFVIKKDRVLVGFREKNGRYLADINSCAVLHPKVAELLPVLQQIIGTMEAKNTIPQIEVAVAKNDVVALVWRHLKVLSVDDQVKILTFAKKYNIALYLQPGKYTSIHKIWPTNGIDLLSYELPAYNLELYFHPVDFIQVNPEINHKMLTRAIEWLDVKSTDNILDLFCGLGNFTLPMATIAKSVVGVEGDRNMVNRASYNAKANNITNAEFHMANLFESCDDLEWTKNNYDKVLIDPPRSGVGEIVLNKIIDWNIKAILYVSCNPETLATDAAILQKNGYKLEKLCVLDMFPHTKHVESMALFSFNPLMEETS